MAQKLKMLTGEVTAPMLGWATDDTHHVVITETGVEVARGKLRYSSEAPGHVDFPSEVAVGEAWEGWIDGLNVGNATGTFKFRLSSTSDCSSIIDESDPFTLEPGTYAVFIVTGVGPMVFWICLMREVT